MMSGKEGEGGAAFCEHGAQVGYGEECGGHKLSKFV